MSNQNDDAKAVLNMTAGTIGADILKALVTELKLLPEPWPKLSQKKQDDIIDRLRARGKQCQDGRASSVRSGPDGGHRRSGTDYYSSFRKII
jgi:hypothetical protein